MTNEPSKEKLIEIYNNQLKRKEKLEGMIDSPLGTQASLFSELLKLEDSLIKLSILINPRIADGVDSEDLSNWEESELFKIIEQQRNDKEQQEKGESNEQ